MQWVQLPKYSVETCGHDNVMEHQSCIVEFYRNLAPGQHVGPMRFGPGEAILQVEEFLANGLASMSSPLRPEVLEILGW